MAEESAHPAVEDHEYRNPIVAAILALMGGSGAIYVGGGLLYFFGINVVFAILFYTIGFFTIIPLCGWVWYCYREAKRINCGEVDVNPLDIWDWILIFFPFVMIAVAIVIIVALLGIGWIYGALSGNPIY